MPENGSSGPSSKVLIEAGKSTSRVGLLRIVNLRGIELCGIMVRRNSLEVMINRNRSANLHR